MLGIDHLLQSLAGNRIRANTRNTSIRGKFNVSTTLELETTNAPIDVEASLVNGDGEESTRLVLKTSNGYVGASSRRPTLLGLWLTSPI